MARSTFVRVLALMPLVMAKKASCESVRQITWGKGAGGIDVVQQVSPGHTDPPEFREVVASTSKGLGEVGEIAIGEYDESSGARRARVTDAGAIREYSDKVRSRE